MADREVSVRKEVLAALTITLVGLPQCLAYAMISGVPPAYGLVTAAVPGLIAAIVGKSAQIITGPTNTTGLLILIALSPFLGSAGVIGPEGLPILAALTLLAGTIRVVLALAGGDVILDFIPESVLTGFLTGAAVLIGAMQIDEALGLHGVSAGSLIGQLREIGSELAGGGVPQLGAIAIALVTTVALLIARRRRPTWPIALVVVVASAALAASLGFDAAHGVPVVGDRTAMSLGWPPVALPSTDLTVWRVLALPALAIVLLGTLEMTVSARAGGAMPDLKREILAQGAANIGGAFVGAFPASASLTRSTLLRLGGGQTRLAAGLSAVLVVPILLLAAPLANYIPTSCIAGVLFVTSVSMIDVARIRRMLAVGGDTRMLLILTFAGSLVLPLEWAIVGGALVALARHLNQATRPRIRAYAAVGDVFEPLLPGAPAQRCVVEVSGTMYYAAIRNFLSDLATRVPRAAKVVVLDLSHAHQMRYAAMSAFERFAAEVEARGGRVVLAGVSPEFAEYLSRAGSSLRVYRGGDRVGESVRSALAEA